MLDLLTNSTALQSDVWRTLFIERLHRLIMLRDALDARPGADDAIARLISRSIFSAYLDCRDLGLESVAQALLQWGVRTSATASYDVVIVGGSFAGLATAMQLRGHRVLVIDQYPIGAHQSSTCGVPLAMTKAVGAEEAIYEVHDTLVVHTGGHAIRFSTPEPYVTVNYQTFCEAMLAQSDAEVRLARATGCSDGVVTTTAGPIRAHFVVDATGWRSLAKRGVLPPQAMQLAGRGIETELPVRLDITPGLHFFFERRIVPHGYAWIFPCGERTRIGLGAAGERLRLRERLAAFVGELGLEVGPTHGGVMPIVRQEPLVDDLFVVGDAAGHCLPATAEGIRAAIVDGSVAGRLIAAALDGLTSPADAQAAYRAHVCRTDRFQRGLLTLQRVVERTPEWLLALAAYACSPDAISHRILRSYFARSGWPSNGDPLPDVWPLHPADHADDASWKTRAA